MPRRIVLFALCVVAGACASSPKRPAVAPGPSPSERMAAADALVRAGCFDCLLAAFREYDALRSEAAVAAAATVGATRTAALLAIRERDLGTEDSGYLKQAAALAASAPANDAVLSALLEIAETLPTRGGARTVTDDTALARNQAALRNQAAWTEMLRLHADDDPLAAYLWLSFNCAYVSAGRQAIGDWLAAAPTWRDTTLLKFKAAICSGYTRSSFDALLEAEPRFVELNYFIGVSAAFAGKIDDAIDHLLRAYAWRQRWPGVTYTLAADYVALEEFDKAIEFYDHTLEILPTFPDALLEKGKAQTYAGRYAEAIATLDRLLALERWLIGDARYWRAVNENQLEQLEVAWDDVERAARLMRNAAVPKLAGIIAYKRHQLDVAREKFEESWKLGRDDCETGFYLGIVLGEQSAWARTAQVLTDTTACLEKAEEKLKAEAAAIQVSTDHPERQLRQIRKREQDIAKGRRMTATAWFNIAVSYFSLSRKDEARAYAQKVADDEQFGERARDLLSRLRDHD
jgi:tetratricopeptide (TPR) repeat protein